jgi:hypothetical protein
VVVRLEVGGLLGLVDGPRAGERQAEVAGVAVGDARPAERLLVAFDGLEDRVAAAVEDVPRDAPDVRTNAAASRLPARGRRRAPAVSRVSPVTYSDAATMPSAGTARCRARSPSTAVAHGTR